MTQEPIARTKHHILCPHCSQGEATVDHCEPGFVSRWVCDECGGHYRIERPGKSFQFLLEPLLQKTLVTLESKGPVRLIVEGMSHTLKDGKPDPEDHDEFFYNEHTCPTNFMHNVVKVVDPADGNEDPHGIFAYVSTAPWTEQK